MLPRDYANQNCSIASTLEVVGDRWTLLVLREACLGVRRFADFQGRLGVARTVLSDRLNRLVGEGILERRVYQDRPERFEYLLTEKGADLWPVLAALRAWGDRYVMDGKPPVLVYHAGCGGNITDRRTCAACGAEVGLPDIEHAPGPGAAFVA